MRSRNPANRPPSAADCFARKQQPAATGPGVALRKQARRRVRRSGAAKAIMRSAPGRRELTDGPDLTAQAHQSGDEPRWQWPLNEPLMHDWLITAIAEYPKRLGGWQVLYCCPAAHLASAGRVAGADSFRSAAALAGLE